MPSFDIISEVNMHEVTNAVDQANREVANRFDFKGTDAEFQLSKDTVTLVAQNDFQLKQMLDIMQSKLSKRNVDVRSLDISNPQISLNQAMQTIKIKQGIDQPTAKELNKIIKDSNIKVQSSIQGEKLRVTGKKRDDLQAVMAFLRGQELKIALQFDNFRD